MTDEIMKTIYISGPITDKATGQPREGWQKDFLAAEAKLRGMAQETTTGLNHGFNGLYGL